MARPCCKLCRRAMAWTLYGEYFRCPDCDPLPDLLLEARGVRRPQQERLL